MSLVLRIVLVIGSVLTTLYIMRRIRNAKAQIEDAIFWLILAVLLIIISIFPVIPSAVARLLGFTAPVNFLFLFMIFILLVKAFTMSLKISSLEMKLRNLTQELAIREKETKDDGQENV
ncbi:MAG: DUF2304 domain-containing protein [Clostridiales bacterium]|nr:DUF2304 domain-containing protein [Clostridiales bacterium]